jgi:hypothetical protein
LDEFAARLKSGPSPHAELEHETQQDAADAQLQVKQFGL